MSDIKIETEGSKIYVTAPFNREANADYRQLQGRWDAGRRVWTFAGRDIDNVRGALRRHFGRDDRPTELVDVRLRWEDGEVIENDESEVVWGGRVILSRRYRDAAVRLGDNVVKISGGFYERAGSMKYPAIGEARGETVIEVRGVPADHQDIRESDATVVDSGAIDKQALREERARLLARIEEIDKLLSE